MTVLQHFTSEHESLPFDEQEQPLVLPPQELLDKFENVNVLAPLVRHSKLPFRHLVSKYSTHITHTPMILSEEFSRNSIARESDFSTSVHERGTFEMVEKNGGRKRKVRGRLIAQLAAKDGKSFADAAELIHPYVDGIDLNCGCPQSWAYKEHIGSWLLRQPEVVHDIVKTAKARLGSNYPVSIKIRIDSDLRNTQRLVETALQVGVSHITIHGRLRTQASTEPVDLDGIKFGVEVVGGRVPVVGNGDIWSLDDAVEMRRRSGVSGVMAARGLLANPALFDGYERTPDEAVNSFVQLATSYGLIYPLFHRHIAYMMESRFHAMGGRGKVEKMYLNHVASQAGVLDLLDEMGILKRGLI